MCRLLYMYILYSVARTHREEQPVHCSRESVIANRGWWPGKWSIQTHSAGQSILKLILGYVKVATLKWSLCNTNKYSLKQKKTCNKMPKFTWYSIIHVLLIPSASMHVVLSAIMGYSFSWPYLLFLSYRYTYISICTYMVILPSVIQLQICFSSKTHYCSSLINCTMLTLHGAPRHLLGCQTTHASF
jgi:hypothetical protein